MPTNKQDTLKPYDLTVAFGLLDADPDAPPTFAELGQRLGMSPSTVHQSVRRLQGAGLLRAESRIPNRRALTEFVAHGVRYAFPASVGREVRGVPTAHSGPVLQAQFDAEDAFVWPDASGPSRGTSLTPLYPGATTLPERAPEVYQLLTLVDALRVGRARERAAAITELHRRLRSVPPPGQDGD